MGKGRCSPNKANLAPLMTPCTGIRVNPTPVSRSIDLYMGVQPAQGVVGSNAGDYSRYTRVGD